MVKNIATVLLRAALLILLGIALLPLLATGLWIYAVPPVAAGYVAAVLYGSRRPASPGGSYLAGMTATVAVAVVVCGAGVS